MSEEQIPELRKNLPAIQQRSIHCTLEWTRVRPRVSDRARQHTFLQDSYEVDAEGEALLLGCVLETESSEEQALLQRPQRA